MRTLRPFIIALLSLIWMMPAQATDNEKVLGVVELFTSQGCPSCPPADKVMAELIQSGDVIGLSYHVDYWDYLGWADTLANAGNTERQYSYAEAMNRSGVYTPQAVINGRGHANGSDIETIRKTLVDDSEQKRGLRVPVSARVEKGSINIDVGEDPATNETARAEVVVVYFNRHSTVKVARGENAGATLDYWHNVQDVQVIGNWSGSSERFTLPESILNKPQRDGLAVLVQRVDEDGDPLEIFGATILILDK